MRWVFRSCAILLLIGCGDSQSSPASSSDAATEDAETEDAAAGLDATAPADASSAEGNAGSGELTGAWHSDCEQVHELRAHALMDEATPYHVTPEMTDAYVCFYFAAPWGESAVQGLEVRSAIDQRPVVHHWLLYATDKLPAAPGSVRQCLGFDGINMLVTGWAPGRDDLRMPDEVGLHLPSGPTAGLILQIHYYAAGMDVMDSSGLDLCTTTRFREQTATISWLGTTAIDLAAGAAGTALGFCTPNSPEPIHVLRTWPHMHRLGRHMQSTVVRADGRLDVLLDMPFDFDYQTSYPTPLTLMPGDRVETRCDYVNDTAAPVGFGENTNEEMCWALVYAYPANRLRGGSMFANRNFCINSF